MESVGKLKGITRDVLNGEWLMTFSFHDLPPHDDIKGGCTLDVTAKRHMEKRSKNANALLWECLGRIAASLRADK